MSLIVVIVAVVILACIATFAPLQPRFSTLFYWLAVGIVIIYLFLLLIGWVALPEVGTRRRIVVD